MLPCLPMIDFAGLDAQGRHFQQELASTQGKS